MAHILAGTLFGRLADKSWLANHFVWGLSSRLFSFPHTHARARTRTQTKTRNRNANPLALSRSGSGSGRAADDSRGFILSCKLRFDCSFVCMQWVCGRPQTQTQTQDQTNQPTHPLGPANPSAWSIQFKPLNRPTSIRFGSIYYNYRVRTNRIGRDSKLKTQNSRDCRFDAGLRAVAVLFAATTEGCAIVGRSQHHLLSMIHHDFGPAFGANRTRPRLIWNSTCGQNGSSSLIDRVDSSICSTRSLTRSRANKASEMTQQVDSKPMHS